MLPPTGRGLVPNVRKIAALRANAVGDFIFVLPALEALRAAYPGAEIVLLGRRWHAGFLAGRPGPVDRVLVVPASRGVNGDEDQEEDPAALERFFAAAAAERFDLALQLHGGGRYSNPFVRRLGARLTAGLKTPDAVPLDYWVPYLYFQPEAARYLEVVALVGARPVTLAPRLAVTERDRAESFRVAPENGKPLAVLHPGAGDPRRRWPAGKFAAVGDALAGAGACVAVNGIPPEREVCRAVIGAMRAEAINLCGKLSLGGLAGLFARSAVVVSNDSGPLHLAGAVGAAAVGIYWCCNLFTASPLTRARHRPFASWRLHCPVCDTNYIQGKCGHTNSLVADVPTREVTAAALELLAAAEAGPPPDGPRPERRNAVVDSAR